MRITLAPEACRMSNSAWHLQFIGKREGKVVKAWLLLAGQSSIVLEVSIFQRRHVPLYIRAANEVLASFPGGVTARVTVHGIETAGQRRSLFRRSSL